jgi:hypothetical protein
MLDINELLKSTPLGTSHGQRTLRPFDTKDLQQEVPVPTARFAFHGKAHLARMLFEQ